MYIYIYICMSCVNIYIYIQIHAYIFAWVYQEVGDLASSGYQGARLPPCSQVGSKIVQSTPRGHAWIPGNAQDPTPHIMYHGGDVRNALVF